MAASIDCRRHLSQLGPFIRAIRESVRSQATPSEKADAWLSEVSAECVQCGIRMTGAELLSVADPASISESDQRLNRLRQGYCARQSCDSYYYRLQFGGMSGLDWPSILAAAEGGHEDYEGSLPGSNPARPFLPLLLHSPWFVRAATTLAAIAALWVVRQWYVGGTIPLLRQPETFEVDHSGVDEAKSGSE
ncbi:MAG: hypothetical protein U1G07_22540 [Verrucomicrobiota bacterium]